MSEENMSPFEEFFYLPRNSTKRESLLMNKLLFDLQLVQAAEGNYLKVYRTDVDDNGYDIILDAEDISRKIQVKSRMKSAKTSSWKVTKGLLRQTLSSSRKHKISQNMHYGVSGGVILQEVVLKGKGIEITYYYTDLAILDIYSKGIYGNTKNKRLASKIIFELVEGDFHDKVTLPKSAFIKLSSPESLAEILGITNEFLNANLYEWLKCRSDHIQGINSRYNSQEHVEETIAKALDKISA